MTGSSLLDSVEDIEDLGGTAFRGVQARGLLQTTTSREADWEENGGKALPSVFSSRVVSINYSSNRDWPAGPRYRGCYR